MFSEQFIDLLLNFGDDWKVNDVKVNCLSGEVDVYVSFIGTKADSPESLEIGPFYDHREVRRWRHLDTMQFKTYISCGVPRVRSCKGTTT